MALSRRQFIGCLGAAFGMFALAGSRTLEEQSVDMRGIKIGTTYSEREIESLGLNHDDEFGKLLSMGFDFVRLGAYWPNIEKQRGIYDFSIKKQMLDLCEAANQSVVMTIGVKAPRWPEFYRPDWATNLNDPKFFESIREPLLQYLRIAMEELASYRCITHWQVENEPLDPSGEFNLAIPLSLLEEEINLVRELDSYERPIALNLWGNLLTSRGLLGVATQLADVVGIDIYPRTPFVVGGIYTGTFDSDRTLRKLVKNSPKPVWAMELQAEPWERSDEKKFSRSPKSFSGSQQLIQNVNWAVHGLGIQTVCLWGFEYWQKYLQMYGDDSLNRTVRKMLASRR